MSEISHFPKAPKNLIIPLEICSLIINPVTSDTELNFLDLSNQVSIKIIFLLFFIFLKVYGKALHGQNKISFKNGNKYEGEFENGMLHGFLYLNFFELIFDIN